MTVSLLWSPGLFTVFWLNLKMVLIHPLISNSNTGIDKFQTTALLRPLRTLRLLLSFRSLRISFTNLSWWIINGVCETASLLCSISWGFSIHRLHLCRGVRPPPQKNQCPWYDTKESDGEVPVMLKILRWQSTHSLPLLPGPLGPRMVALEWALSLG